MADAGTHGASASPDFGPRWRQLVETIHRQRAAMQAAGRSMADGDADRLLRTELRSALQDLPPAQLERILNADDPLAAATPFLTTAQAAQLEIRLDGQPPSSPPAALVDHGSDALPPPTAASAADDDALISTGLHMLAAGVRQGAAAPSGDGHGLTGTQPRQAANRVVPANHP